MDAIQWVKSKNVTHIYLPFFDRESVYSTVKKINNLYPLDVLIIDYFKSTGNEIGAFETYAQMGKNVDCVKNEIAGAMNIAAIGAAQAATSNRLADSAKIARNASTIIMMSAKTPEENEEDGPGSGNRKLYIPFNRNGAQHSDGEWINLDFDGDHILFTQADVQHVPATPY